jgi:hypothetical protein
VRMFGWNALSPSFALPKYHSLLGWLGATYRITNLSIRYLWHHLSWPSPRVACLEGHSHLPGFVQLLACGRNGIRDSIGASVPPETRASGYWVHAAERLAWAPQAAFASRFQTSLSGRFRRVPGDE